MDSPIEFGKSSRTVKGEARPRNGVGKREWARGLSSYFVSFFILDRLIQINPLIRLAQPDPTPLSRSRLGLVRLPELVEEDSLP